MQKYLISATQTPTLEIRTQSKKMRRNPLTNSTKGMRSLFAPLELLMMIAPCCRRWVEATWMGPHRMLTTRGPWKGPAGTHGVAAGGDGKVRGQIRTFRPKNLWERGRGSAPGGGGGGEIPNSKTGGVRNNQNQPPFSQCGPRGREAAAGTGTV